MSSAGSTPSSSSYPSPMAEQANGASNTALRAALQAMKERCQQLQNRLSMMEEENLQLRIERHSIPEAVKRDSTTVVDVAALLRKLEELNRQKSKLSHHIYMVANENKHLWEHLSKITDEKSVDGDLRAYKPKKSLSTLIHSPSGNQSSLDEIPLRMSHGHQKDINMVDWNTITSIKDCEYPIMDVDDDDGEDGMMQTELVNILTNFEEEKRLLKLQQQGLKAAIDVISKMSKSQFHPTFPTLLRSTENSQSCTIEEYQDLQSMSSEIDETNRSEGEVMKVSSGVTLRNKENNFEDRICPLCTKFYAKSTPFDEFNDHVLSHFVEDSDQDSHLSFHEIVA